MPGLHMWKAKATASMLCAIGIHVWVNRRPRARCWYCREPRNGRLNLAWVPPVFMVGVLVLVIVFGGKEP